MEQLFFYDETGSPRASFAKPFSPVGDFLEGDLQSCLASCDNYLKACENVLNNSKIEESMTGNAFTATIKKNEVTLENNYDSDENCVISIKEFQSAINSWKKLLLK